MSNTLTIGNLCITHRGRELVSGVDLAVEQGEWFALIGESGSGKSITAFSVAGLLPPGLRRSADTLSCCGEDLLQLTEEEYRRFRGERIAYVFQDYQGAFTPYYTIGAQMDEMLRAHRDWDLQERHRRSAAALEEVGLDAGLLERYPFQVSGGQLQRAALALALTLEPTLLIADEPTTALDAINAAVVLDLIAQMKERLGCAVLFITHDLRCVKRYADRVAIMQLGRIIESGTKKKVLGTPEKTYTRNLLASIPPLRGVPERLPVAGSDDMIEAEMEVAA